MQQPIYRIEISKHPCLVIFLHLKWILFFEQTPYFHLFALTQLLQNLHQLYSNY